jgi:hypothetical protein
MAAAAKEYEIVDGNGAPARIRHDVTAVES